MKGLIRPLKGRCGFDQAVESMQISDMVGKLLFPKQDRWERRQNAKFVLMAVSIILVLLVGLVLFVKGTNQKNLNTAPQVIFHSPIPS
jgi:hypothetical protein